MTMRILLLLSLMIFGVAPASAADTVPSIEVWKSATCKCCGAWVKHLEADGFTVKVNAAEPSTLASLKRQAGIGDRLASCHTAMIDGYVAHFGLVIEPEQLRREALEWATTRGSRSGRTAWQYIQDLAGRLEKRLEG